MDEQFLENITRQNVCSNIGPNAKEIFLHQAATDYASGNTTRSVYYQVMALYQNCQERFLEQHSERVYPSVDELLAGFSVEEAEEFENNCLIQYVSKALKQNTSSEINNNPPALPECNFLKGIINPSEGIAKLEEICKQMPNEWTILQLCKAARTETTFSIYPKIHESDADIYLSILKHSRSEEYPTPICLRFSGNEEQKELFKKFGCMVQHLKKCINVDPKEWSTPDAKKIYWKLIGELNKHMGETCADLKNYFYPWKFLFSGVPKSHRNMSSYRQRWRKIDELCNTNNLDNQTRVLLSLAADHILNLSSLEIEGICSILIHNTEHRKLVCLALNEMQWQELKAKHKLPKAGGCYPCILVVDERLDHFFWEEMNVEQEISRVSSLQCLWGLYSFYKKDIKDGYLNVDIINGGYVLNPDENLPKMELRMRSFYDYWMPHWTGIVGRRPTEDELSTKFFSNSCYVYSGHGSGLQYIKGHNLAKFQIKSVVFLFGCDSSRLHSNGLYSELIGPHLYYHAAMCPTLVGTIMPCLDASMDKVATEILSRWIAPKSKTVLPWNTIEVNDWVKQGIIKSPASATTTTMAKTPNYHMGSLCAVVAKVHQRTSENKFYNTLPYVCRGLPVWNCHVEPLLHTI